MDLPPVWTPNLKKHIGLLKRIPQSITKILPMIKKMGYKDRLTAMDLPKLEERRKRENVNTTFKIKSRFGNVDIDQLF